MMSYVLVKHKPELTALLLCLTFAMLAFFRCNLQQTASLVAPSRIAILCKDQSIALTLKTDGKITVHGGNVHLVDQMLLCRAILFCWFFGFKRILALFSWRYFFSMFPYSLRFVQSIGTAHGWHKVFAVLSLFILLYTSLYIQISASQFV